MNYLDNLQQALAFFDKNFRGKPTGDVWSRGQPQAGESRPGLLWAQQAAARMGMGMDGGMGGGMGGGPDFFADEPAQAAPRVSAMPKDLSQFARYPSRSMDMGAPAGGQSDNYLARLFGGR